MLSCTPPISAHGPSPVNAGPLGGTTLTHPEMSFVAAGLFILLCLAHGHLVSTVVLGQGTEPAIVFAGHLVCLVLAIICAAAIWRRRLWAWRSVVAYGVALAILILSLGPALQLPSDARVGLWISAGSVVALSSAGAWLLYRSSRA